MNETVDGQQSGGIEELSANDFRAIRLEKINQIKALGINPYPERYDCTHTLKAFAEVEVGSKDISIAGRLTAIRVMGNLTFATLSDIEGKAQIAFQKKLLGDDYNFIKKLVDIGDFLGVVGEVDVTKTGEKTLSVKKFDFLGKALLPLPEKFHGVTDREKCYRQRYLDLIMSENTRSRFLLRSKVISKIRRYLEDNEFLEVETPVLCNKPSGALAKPFITHHNSLDIDVYMRIAPETYLKRCVVAGYNKVFEFSRCFRNEGISPMHLQDFTMLEYYCAYWNYEDNMNFTEKLIKKVLQETLGSLSLKIGDKEVNFDGSWPRTSFRELILKDSGIDINLYPDADALREAIKSSGIHIDDMEKLGLGNLIDNLYKKVSRPHLLGPVFITKHPIDLSPLARSNDDDKKVVDRFQLVVDGAEIINAYSELVDPIDQRERLEDQAAAKEGGDAEAMEMDEDYVHCMEYGMPPISGWGMGIDRFLALLTNSENIRDVVLFPLNRPESTT